ncbi:MAG: Maf family protein [Candidatus Omnitrophota bacterium]|jgi:septum formation protein
MKAVILASGSKKRSQILSSCGIRHKVYITNAEEAHLQNRSARWNVMENAGRKALACAKIYKNNIIIAADTLVVLDKKLIGKPKNKDEAKKLFYSFSGRKLTVCTGLCVMDTAAAKKVCGAETSYLYARRLLRHEFGRYFESLKPYDKAGGFSIEGIGSFLYDDIRGSYFNILGLPMGCLKDLFNKAGLEILDICNAAAERPSL